MRFAGVGLLILGALIGAAAILASTLIEALVALVAGGFLFVAGAVFATGVSLQDAIKRRG